MAPGATPGPMPMAAVSTEPLYGPAYAVPSAFTPVPVAVPDTCVPCPLQSIGFRIGLRDQRSACATRVVGVTGEVEAADHLRGGRSWDREAGGIVRCGGRVRGRAAGNEVVGRRARAAETAMDIVDAGVDHGDAHAGSRLAVAPPCLQRADQRHARVVVELDQRNLVDGDDTREGSQVVDQVVPPARRCRCRRSAPGTGPWRRCRRSAARRPRRPAPAHCAPCWLCPPRRRPPSTRPGRGPWCT